MSYFFTSESVSEGHPDKVADQISDAVLDAYLIHDPNAKVACETFVTTGLVIIGGEIKTEHQEKGVTMNVQDIARDVIRKIGYIKSEYQFDADSCGIITVTHEQSSDIRQGVEQKEQGAGDQGMMFGYACSETDNYMPLTLDIAHLLVQELSVIRKEGKKMKYLRPDAKSQVTVQYSDKGKPERIDTIVISTQHDDFEKEDIVMLEQIKSDVENILIPRVKKQLPSKVKRLFNEKIKYHVNPTGKFVIGGPHGDTGLTGRKIIVDTYGGKCAHGGGAFSGKDSSKVDRCAAYAARHIARNLVAAGVCSEVEIQVAYAIGIANPVSFYVNTFGTSKVRDSAGKKLLDGEIARRVEKIFDMRPKAIVERLGLLNPIFSATAAYGHFGRKPSKIKVNGKEYESFTWERDDYVEKIRKEFSLSVKHVPSESTSV